MLKPVAPLLAALALVAAPLAARAAPPVWTIHDADSTILLFGSVHILKAGSDWEPKALTEALAKADDLWFEIPMDEAGQLAASQAAIRRGLLPTDKSLRSLLGPKDRARLERAAVRLKIDIVSLDRLQPWLAEATLSDLTLMGQGAAVDQGVEQTLQNNTPAHVARRAFETPDGQIAILAGASAKAQLASLSDTLRAIEDEPDDFNRLVSLWMKADVRGLDREAVEDLRRVSLELYDLIIKRRNTSWVAQIKQRLAGSGETVMVVGVGHLVGPDSVPAMLRAQGIRVDGP